MSSSGHDWFLPIAFHSIFGILSKNNYLTERQIDKINDDVSKLLNIPKPHVHVPVQHDNEIFTILVGMSNNNYNTLLTLSELKESWNMFIRGTYDKQCSSMRIYATCTHAKNRMIERVNKKIDLVNSLFIM